MSPGRNCQGSPTEPHRDGRISNRDLADRVHLSESTCLRRVRSSFALHTVRKGTGPPVQA
jgi:hypothetical protein